MEPLTPDEAKACLAAAFQAAFSDGGRSDPEREALRRLVAERQEGGLDLEALRQEVLGGAWDAARIVRELKTTEQRRLAYEMAVCVCDADGVATPREKEFLADLRSALGVDLATGAAVLAAADQLVGAPLDEGPPTTPAASASARNVVAPAAPPAAVDEAEIDSTVQKTALLCGGLELLPDRLATLAILPIQMRMVFKIGKRYGYELDRGHIRDFLATLGVGMASQLVERFAKKAVSGLFGKLAGGLVGGVLGGATSPAMSYATTYALGQAAKQYYAGGRKLSALELRSLFSTLQSDGKALQRSHASSIEREARRIDAGKLVSLVQES